MCLHRPANGKLATPVNYMILPDRMCDCCRPALAFTSSREAVLFVRLATADGLRDHGSFRLGPDGVIGPGRPGTRDDWRLNGCPHHGPAIAVDRRGRYHAAWFTGSDRRQGLFYASSPDAGLSYTEARAIGGADRRASHPDVLVDGADRVWLTWTERAAGASRLLVQSSTDAGATWGAPRQLAETTGLVDYPFLHQSQERVFVSWFTAADGLKILRVSGTHRPN
jgi:hypothetical protein